jgi:hypothetical protein
MITTHFVGVHAIIATHINGKRGFLLGGTGRGYNHVQKHKHNGAPIMGVSSPQFFMANCLGQSKGFGIIRTIY